MSSKFYHEETTPKERDDLRSRAGKDIDDYNYKHQARHPDYPCDPLPDSFIDYSAACLYVEKAREAEERAQRESPPRSATSVFNLPTTSRAATMSSTARSVVAVSPSPPPHLPPSQYPSLPVHPTAPTNPSAASSKKRPNPKPKNNTATPTSPHRCHACGTLLSYCACAREWATSPRRWHRSRANPAAPPPPAPPAQWPDDLHRSSGPAGALPPQSGYQEIQWERVWGKKKERYERVTQTQELSGGRTEPVGSGWRRRVPRSAAGADDGLDGADEQRRGGAASEASLGFGTRRGGGWCCKGVCDGLVPRIPRRRSKTGESWTPTPARPVQEKLPLRRGGERVALPARVVRPQLAPLEIPRGGWRPPGWPSPTWVRKDQNSSSYSPRPVPYEQLEWPPCYCPFSSSSSSMRHGFESDDEGQEIRTTDYTPEEFSLAIRQIFEVEAEKKRREATLEKGITAQKRDMLQGKSTSREGNALHKNNALGENDTSLPKDTSQQHNPPKQSDSLQENGSPQGNQWKHATDTQPKAHAPPIVKLRGGWDLDWDPQRVPSRLWFCAGGMGQPPTYKEYGRRRAGSRKRGQQMAKKGYYKGILHWGLPGVRIRGGSDDDRHRTVDDAGSNDADGNGGDSDIEDKGGGEIAKRNQDGIHFEAHIRNIGPLYVSFPGRDSHVHNHTSIGREIHVNARPEDEMAMSQDDTGTSY